MCVRSTIASSSMIGGAILLVVQGFCRAEVEGAPPASTAAAAPAADALNPYLIISDRNVFRLNPPPPPPAVDRSPPPDLPKVYLSGFMRTGDRLEVLLVVKCKNQDRKEADLTSYLTLVEGAKDGVVELVKVYAGEEKVDIINSGTPMTLSMKDNSLIGDSSPPASAAAALSPIAGRRSARPVREQASLVFRDASGAFVRHPPSSGGEGAAPAETGNPQGDGAIVGGGAGSP